MSGVSDGLKFSANAGSLFGANTHRNIRDDDASAVSHFLNIGKESTNMTFGQIATTATLFAATVAVSGPAFADYPCSSIVGAVKIDDNVFVAGNCSLVGTVVKGNERPRSAAPAALFNACAS